MPGRSQEYLSSIREGCIDRTSRYLMELSQILYPNPAVITKLQHGLVHAFHHFFNIQ